MRVRDNSVPPPPIDEAGDSNKVLPTAGRGCFRDCAQNVPRFRSPSHVLRTSAPHTAPGDRPSWRTTANILSTSRRYQASPRRDLRSAAHDRSRFGSRVGIAHDALKHQAARRTGRWLCASTGQDSQSEPANAIASISTSQSGSARLATTASVLAGKCPASLKTRDRIS